MRIDSHHHVWDLSVREQGWMVGDAVAPVRRNFDMNDYRAASVGTGIEKTVLVQTVMLYEETPEYLALASSDELIAGVVGWLKIDAEDAIEHLDHYQTLLGHEYLVGIRDIAHDYPDPDYLGKAAVIANVQEIGRRGFAYDILSKTPQMKASIKLIENCPETTLVIDHISKPMIADGVMEPWKELIKVMASFPNTYCKVSGMVTEAKWNEWKVSDFRPYFEVLVESFTPARLMFGSDWPVSVLAGGYRKVIDLAEELTTDFSASEKEDFWSGTAIRAYKLDLGA